MNDTMFNLVDNFFDYSFTNRWSKFKLVPLEDYLLTNNLQSNKGFKIYNNNLIIELGLPGIKKEDVTVEYNDNILHISWKDREGVFQAEDQTISRNYEISKTTSKLENGLLTVAIPKKEELKPTKKQIKVE